MGNVAESKTSPNCSQPRGISHRRKPIYESLATLASLTALVVGLVAALGFPAAILQFNRLRIPTELLSYGRSLRAGIIPTVMLVIGCMVLLVIGRFLASMARKAAKRGRADDEQDSDGVLSFVKLLLVLPFVLWFIAFMVAAMITFVWWPFVFFRYLWRNLGAIWTVAHPCSVALRTG